MAIWDFYAIDNGGGKKTIRIKARDKHEAILKGFQKYNMKYAKGDINNWECHLVRA